MKRIVIVSCLTVSLLFIPYSLAFAGVLYVDAKNTNPGNASSWATAVKTIQEAVALANDDDEIWVKSGTYKLATTIVVGIHVLLYGGFDGTETKRIDRNPSANVTTVDGDDQVQGFNVSADAVIDGFNIINCTATDGGGIHIENASPTVEDCSIRENDAQYGGGIYIKNASATIANCIFRDNRATNNGGALRIRESDPEIKNCSFRNNTAETGSAINNWNADTLLIDCEFLGDWTDWSGGTESVVYISNSNSEAYPTFNNCIFKDSINDYGAAVYNKNTSPAFINCDFIDQELEIALDIMINDNASPLIQDCRFKDNAWGSGSLMTNSNASSPRIINCEFVNNGSSESVGGIVNRDGAPLIKGCLFESNGGDDTAAILNGNSDAIIENCIFRSNGGGATFGGVIDNYNCSPIIRNCIFDGNSVVTTGGLINDNAFPQIINCIFFRNLGDIAGAVVNLNGSIPSITNCIFRANYGRKDDNISGGAVVTYSNIEGGYDGEGNIDMDPLFEDPDNGLFQLQEFSPCVDKGTAAIANLAETDIEGNPRNQGLDPDMGAYESAYSLTWYYLDSDQDGFGESNQKLSAWSPPAGYVAEDGDCNDNDPNIHPQASEICNGIDDNCDGNIDEGVTDTYYIDGDGDGYGNPSASIQACANPTGYVTDSTDCDDTNAAVHPGVEEIDNDIDDNCDGKVDEGFEDDPIGPAGDGNSGGGGGGGCFLSSANG